MDDHARTASQDTSMTSDLCNFQSEVNSHRLLTPSSQDYHRYCIPVIQSPDLRAQCIFNLALHPSTFREEPTFEWCGKFTNFQTRVLMGFVQTRHENLFPQ